MKNAKWIFMLFSLFSGVTLSSFQGLNSNTPDVGKTIKIGSQVWMVSNLNVSTFRNGDAIPQVQNKAEWEQAGRNHEPAWCYYENDPANGEKYGKLYNWFAVNDSRGLAPQGWHVPSDQEWTLLTDYLGGAGNAGTKMKSTTGWNNNGNGTNESDFSGLPGGNRNHYGDFFNFGDFGCWWSSSEDGSNYAWFRNLNFRDGEVYRPSNGYKGNGGSVRCLRD